MQLSKVQEEKKDLVHQVNNMNSCAAREKTPLENEFDNLFLSIRNLDKLLWSKSQDKNAIKDCEDYVVMLNKNWADFVSLFYKELIKQELNNTNIKLPPNLSNNVHGMSGIFIKNEYDSKPYYTEIVPPFFKEPTQDIEQFKKDNY